MCGRFFIALTKEELQDMANAPQIVEKPQHHQISIGEVFPGTMCGILTGNPYKSLPGTPMAAYWGFNLPNMPRPLINARDDALLVKPMWKRMAQSSRCIVPASGYYEWEKDGTRKYKKLISTGQVLYMAGLLGETEVKGVKVPAFTIITTEPSAQIAYIHDRMPVILKPEAAQIWLNDKINPEYFSLLLVPYQDELIVESA